MRDRKLITAAFFLFGAGVMFDLMIHMPDDVQYRNIHRLVIIGWGILMGTLSVHLYRHRFDRETFPRIADPTIHEHLTPTLRMV